MAKIETYVRASSPISGADKLIGTDSANNNETKNFTIQEISDFVGLGPYKVYTALLRQDGESNTLEIVQGGTLSVGVTYYIFINDDNVDLTAFGAPNSNVGTYFVCTQAGGLPGGVNISLQYNTGAPKVMSVLQNTLGDIWFEYYQYGLYYALSDSLFTLNKTFILGNNWGDDNATGRTFSAYCDNVNQLTFGNSTGDDNNLFMYIEIRVYN